MKKLLELEPSVCTASFNYVNCFEKPVGMILGNNNANDRTYFYLFLKMLQCYKFDCFDEESTFYSVSYNEIMQYIIGDMLNQEMKTEHVSAIDLHKTVKKNIDKDRFAMVPINLKVYPDSEYYEEYDWRHVLLITGYDEEEKLYYVCDNGHEEGNDGSQYTSHSLSFDFVQELYISAVQCLGVETVWSMSCHREEPDYTDKELFNNVLDLYLYNREKQAYLELDYLEQIDKEIHSDKPIKVLYEGEEILKSIDFTFLRTLRYKELFFECLVKTCKELGVESEDVQKVERLGKEIIALWTEMSNSLLINYHAKKEFDLTDQIVMVTSREKKLYKEISKINTKLNS